MQQLLCYGSGMPLEYHEIEPGDLFNNPGFQNFFFFVLCGDSEDNTRASAVLKLYNERIEVIVSRSGQLGYCKHLWTKYE